MDDFGMEVLALVALIVNIIFLVKIWNACSDIKRLADKYAPTMTNSEKANKKAAKVTSTTPETREEMEAWLSSNNKQ